jgi:hypothetical protein
MGHAHCSLGEAALEAVSGEVGGGKKAEELWMKLN